MENRTGKISSDAEWYCRKDPEEECFYEIFFQMCQKYGVRWASAEEKERQFIEEVTRITYERERELRLGFSLSNCINRTELAMLPEKFRHGTGESCQCKREATYCEEHTRNV